MRALVGTRDTIFDFEMRLLRILGNLGEEISFYTERRKCLISSSVYLMVIRCS